MSDLVSKTKVSLKWSALERILTQSIQFALAISLARLLGPKTFGLVGMISIFIAISNVFIDGGFSSALIRKEDRTDNDLKTAFYYNISLSCICYAAIYIISPYVAYFYHQSELLLLLRVFGLVLIINSFSLIPRVLLTVSMNFKLQAIVSIVSVISGGGISLAMSINGFGVWSLVAQSIIIAVCNSVLLNIMLPWHSKGSIKKDSFNYLFCYGSKLLLSGILDTIYGNLYQMIIGKRFSPELVGQYTQANQISSIPAMTLTTIIQRVTFPMFSKLQSNECELSKAYRITLKLAAIIIFPLVIGIAIIAQPLFILLLGEKWNYASILLSVLCVGYMLYPIHAVNLNILQVMGRSDLFLKLEVIKKIIGIVILLFTIHFGVFWMVVGISVYSYVSLFLNTYYTSKLTNITQLIQWRDLFPIWFFVVVSGFVGYRIGLYWQGNPYSQIFITLISALAIYILYLFIHQKKLVKQLFFILKNEH